MKSAIGERKIVLNKREYLLRPSYEALMEMEDLAGRGAIEMLHAFSNRKYKTRDTVAVIHACLKAGLTDGEEIPTFDEVSAWVYDMNIVKAATVAAQLISAVFMHGNAKKNEKEQAPQST
jgi:Phage tail tube protein, GTA-gp10